MKNKFMRVIVLFDLPQNERQEQKIYRNFVKFLEQEGYIRIQYSIYTKLCIHAVTAKQAVKKVERHSPQDGDVRYLVVSEKQYQGIKSVQSKYSLQERMTNTKRLLIIGDNDDY